MKEKLLKNYPQFLLWQSEFFYPAGIRRCFFPMLKSDKCIVHSQKKSLFNP